MNDLKAQFQDMIDEAWRVYNELHEEEAATGYDDAMDMAERREAEGFALGLEAAYTFIYAEHPNQNVEPNYYPEEAI